MIDNEKQFLFILLIGILLIPVAVNGIQDNYGQCEFLIRAGGSAQDTTIFIRNADDDLPFDNRFYFTEDVNKVKSSNAGWYQVKIQPDGISLPEVLNAGRIIACIRNGNGAQKECQVFSLLKGEHKRVVFLGHAVSSGKYVPVPDERTCIPVIFKGYTFNPIDGFAGLFDNRNEGTKTVTLKLRYNFLEYVRCNTDTSECIPGPICKDRYEHRHIDYVLTLNTPPGITEQVWSIPFAPSKYEGVDIVYVTNGCN